MVNMNAPSGIRIGNDEREKAIKALDEHMSAGRLDPDEYGQRVAEASVARTREDLEPLFADLPQPHPFAAPPPLPRKGPVAAAERTLRRYAGDSPLVRVAMLVLATLVIIGVAPFALAAALLFFVVLPMLGCGGWRHAPWYRMRYRRRW